MAAIGAGGGGGPSRRSGDGDAEHEWGGRIGRRLDELDAGAGDAVIQARRSLAARTRRRPGRRYLVLAAALGFGVAWALAARRHR